MSLLCILILLIQNNISNFYKIIVVTSIFFCSTYIGCWTFYQGKVPLKENAYLWTLAFPIDFLPGSYLFFYIKSILDKKKKFRVSDIIYFLPAILTFIELIPFYLLPAELKQIALEQYIVSPATVPDDNVFIFPMYAHFALSTGVWILYIIFSVLSLNKFSKKDPSWIVRHRHVWLWMKIVTILQTAALFVSIGCITIFNEYYNELSVLPGVLFIFACIIILMFKPELLYGPKKFLNKSNNSSKQDNIKTFQLPAEKYNKYRKKIDNLIEVEKVYLRKNYLLKDMASDLNIPPHHLSNIINREYGTSYTNFINNCRIKHIIENKDCKEWSQFSIEGIGSAAGFNSRNSFFKAFKSYTGKTPCEFLKKDKIVNY